MSCKESHVPCTEYLPSNRQVRFGGGGKSSRRFTPNRQVRFLGGVNRQVRFLGGGVNRTDNLLSCCCVGCCHYPNCQVQIIWMIYPPPPKSYLAIWGKSSGRFTPPQIVNFEQNFRHTTSCFASQRSFLRKTNDFRLETCGRRFKLKKVRNFEI